MFEPLGTKLLGRRVGRRTCWADTFFDLDFGGLNLDSGFWGVWILEGYGHMVGSKMVSLENTTFQH